jgi:hypothetical protein
MSYEHSYSSRKIRQVLSVRRLYHFFAPRAYSVIMFGALFCTLLVKFFNSWRYDAISEYTGWVLADNGFCARPLSLPPLYAPGLL